ncbi:MAG TPA: hypothetical protein VMZ00_09375 [Sporichthya sp.]|nr:hypothetical protein [Sporichthya sp.]
MLDRPEMVAAFAGQLRRVLSDQAAFVALIRRDAEALWAENPPEGYGSFEAWWRHLRVSGPFAEIQAHIEAAAKLTFRLEARYKKNRHLIPEKRQAAADARQQQALGRGVEAGSAPGPPRQAGSAVRRPAAAPPLDGDFMDMVRKGRSA